jgi:hypothetical protein
LAVICQVKLGEKKSFAEGLIFAGRNDIKMNLGQKNTESGWQAIAPPLSGEGRLQTEVNRNGGIAAKKNLPPESDRYQTNPLT